MNIIQLYGDKINEIDDRRIQGSADKDDLSSLKSLISEMDQLDLSQNNIEDRATFHYYLANAWALKAQLEGEPGYPLNNNENIEQQILNYRKAKALVGETDNRYLQCEIYTNLANLFSHLGRSLEAQELYKECLDIDPSFMMAIGNRGFHLFHAARFASDSLEQYILLRTSWTHLTKASSSGKIYEAARNDFARLASSIEGIYKVEALRTSIT